MQLILETESPSVNIQEKMSTVNEDTFNEIPIANGLKDLIEEINEETKSNGGRANSDKENVKSKDNFVNNADSVKDSINKITESKQNVEKSISSENTEDPMTPSKDAIEEHSAASTCKESFLEDDESSNKQKRDEPKESQNGIVEEESSIEHEEQLANEKTDTENVEFMDVDEKDTNGLVSEELGILESKVTQSINAVVDEIVKGLGEELSSNEPKTEKLEQNVEKQLVNSEISNVNLSGDVREDKDILEDNDVHEDKDVNNDTDVHEDNEINLDIKDEPMKDASKHDEIVPVTPELTTTVKLNPVPSDVDNSNVTSEIVEILQKPTSVDNILNNNITQNSTDIDMVVDKSEQENIDAETSENVNIESVTDQSDVGDKYENQDIKLKSDNIDTNETQAEPSEIIHKHEIQVTKCEEDDVVEDVKKTNVSEINDSKTLEKSVQSSIGVEVNDDVLDVEEIKDNEESTPKTETQKQIIVSINQSTEKETTPVIKLSNTLDILSDDEDELPKKDDESNVAVPAVSASADKQCINLDDDDDIMLIDEETTTKAIEKETSDVKVTDQRAEDEMKTDTNIVDLDNSKDSENKGAVTEAENDSAKPESTINQELPIETTQVEKSIEVMPEKQEKPKPLVPDDFFKTYRKNLSEMTRDDLEEFCILKIVESIIDRSNLNEIRTKLKTMAQNIDEYKKKAMMLTKQNRDLQVVLKSVQEEQKKMTDQPIAPLKITRSVGMQVLMTDKNRRRPVPGPPSATNSNVNTQSHNANNKLGRNSTPRPQKQINNQQIPVPRLVPAVNTTTIKTNNVANQGASNVAKASPAQNGLKATSPVQKAPEKRTHSRMQSQSQSVTVDLTDDEPPTKLVTRNSAAPPVRLVSPQNLLAPRPATPTYNSPRKVYIPISGPQGQAIQSVRPGQTIMLKTVTQGPRGRGPTAPMVRVPQNTMQIRRVPGTRHPAPLPDAMKQYQPPNWKSLPPAPDLKLSKVENGIVISWKIEGYQEDSYEEIASYQLYAYQETSAPPSTALWKKIGDVKALPLPMACTLTQFMAGYKYYFAVRAVDIRSRLGPFSLPGSILLVNKM